MAKNVVTGVTEEEMERRRREYAKKRYQRAERLGIRQDEIPTFKEKYCRARIGKLPDDYDGPDRYCMNTTSYMVGKHPGGRRALCKFHGGKGFDNTEPGTVERPDGPMYIKHGMYAELDNLIDDFDEKEQALYDWIYKSHREAYDIDVEEDPSAAYDLHRLAAEIVRAERGRGWLAKEGEVHEREVRNDEGRIVIDEDGEVVTEKSEHYLANMMHRQDSKLNQIKKELGITRKERLKQDSTDNAVEAIKSFAELGNSIIDRDSKNYDPDDKPWESEENDE